MSDKPSEAPRIEDVVALLDGELEESRAAAVREALRRDPELARAGLDVVDPSALESAAGLAPADVDQAWARFQAGLGIEIEPPVVVASAPPVVPFRRRPAGQPLWALAACLVVGLGLGVLLGSRGAKPSPAGPVLVARLELEGAGPLRGDEPTLAPGADVSALILLLTPPSSLYGELPPRVRYRLTRDGERVGAGEATQQDLGSYAVSLGPAETPPGTYRLELLRRGEDEAFASYVFVREGRP